MNKRLMIFCVTILFMTIPTFSQQKINGKVVTGEDNSPIQGVNIIIKETKTGTTSDENGMFTLEYKSLPVDILFTHISFDSQEIRLKTGDNLTLHIELQPRLSMLSPVSIFSEKIMCLHPQDKFFVTDFRIVDGNIMALAYKNRMQGKQYLVMFSPDGNKLGESEIIGNKGLYQDPEMNCYIRMQNKGWQIFRDSTEFFFSEPFEERLLDTAEKRLAEIKEDTVLIRDYFLSGQGISYYYLVAGSGESDVFRTYINEEGVNMLYWGPFFNGNEFDRRFAEEIFFKPVNIPVFVRDSSKIVVFNFIEGTIEHLSSITDHDCKSVDLQFHKDKTWTGEILYDRAQDKFYTTFSNKGVSTISEIDIYTGQIIIENSLQGYAHIERITVWNGKLYFLYKKHYGDEYKRLYMSSLH
jgi:hypothetical protein